MAAHRAGSSSLPRSPRQVAVGPLRRRSGRVPTPGSQTRLPAPQPRTHTSAFSRTAAFSVTSLGAGYARGSGLRLAVTSGAFAAVPTRQGLPLRGRGQRRDARGPRVRPGALPARGLPWGPPPGFARPARGPRPCPPPEGPACPGEPLRGGRSAQRHVSSWRRAAALEEDRWGERQREVRLSARPQPRRGGSPSSPRVCASRSLAGGEPWRPARRTGAATARWRRRRTARRGGWAPWPRPGSSSTTSPWPRGKRARPCRGPAARRLSGAAGRSGGSRGQRGRGEAGSRGPGRLA